MSGAPLFPEVDTPALLLDETRLRANIATVHERARAAGLSVRPHAKAHKSSHVARLQLAAGAVGLCCAKLGEAEAMAAGGTNDLLITTPVVGSLKIARLVALARRASIATVVDDPMNVSELGLAAAAAGVRLRVLVEIDVGQHRCGVAPGAAVAPLAALVQAEPALDYAGVQGYQGGLQCQPDYAARLHGILAAMERLQRSTEALAAAGLAPRVLTGGGTGSLPVDTDLRLLTELQPGSYVSMDQAYCAIDWQEQGGGMPLQRPLSVLATVISRPAHDRAIVDAGWKTISSDGRTPICAGRPDLIYEFAGDEHGQLRGTHGGPLNLRLGDRVELIPGHCDTTVNLYDRFVVHADGRAHAYWPIDARGMST